MGATPTGFVPHSDIHMTDGASLILEFTIKDQDDAAVPLSLSDAEWVLTDANTVLVTKALGAGVTVTDAPNGVLEVALDPADTDGLHGIFPDDLKLIHLDGREEPGAAFGFVNIRQRPGS